MCLGIPGQIVDFVDDDGFIATADVNGVHRNINVQILQAEDDAVEVGDWVLIHVGFAMSKIDEAEAKATFDFLQELGSQYTDELAELEGSQIE